MTLDIGAFSGRNVAGSEAAQLYLSSAEVQGYLINYLING